MRRVGIAWLAMAGVGTFASSVRAQQPAPALSAPPAPPPSDAKPVATTASSSASGDAMPESGYHLDAGVAFSLPTGSLNGEILGAMPLVVNFGRRFSRQLILGVSGSAAVTFPVIGTGYDFIIGAGAEYYLAKQILGLDPWVGVNGGYEIGGVSVLGQNKSGSGPIGTIAAGLDYRKGFAPFAAFSLGSSGSGDVHEYITVGMRGVYDW